MTFKIFLVKIIHPAVFVFGGFWMRADHVVVNIAPFEAENRVLTPASIIREPRYIFQVARQKREHILPVGYPNRDGAW
jgi:hypothetical protein